MELLGGDGAAAVPASIAIASLHPAPAVADNARSSQAVVATCMEGSSRIDISGKYDSPPRTKIAEHISVLKRCFVQVLTSHGRRQNPCPPRRSPRNKTRRQGPSPLHHPVCLGWPHCLPVSRCLTRGGSCLCARRRRLPARRVTRLLEFRCFRRIQKV